MGLFSSSRKTYVASSVYNMAGDIDLRPNFLRTALIGNTLSNSKAGIGPMLVQAMLSGSGMQQLKFFRWARSNYALGMPTASFGGDWSVDAAAVAAGLAPLLGMPAGSTLRIVSSAVDVVDVDDWAKFWILNNHPDLPDEDWSSDWDPVNGLITIDMVIDGVASSASIPAPVDFVWGLTRSLFTRRLLFVIYQVLSLNATSGLMDVGTPALFTYRMGSGNVIFDSLQTSGAAKTEFFPAIPLRINNKSIRHANNVALFDAVEPAFKKLTGSEVDKLLDQIEEHENIADIDFCFLTQGVSLNTKENEGRRYLYKFFANLIPEQKTSKAEFAQYLADRGRVLEETAAWARWVSNNSAGNDSYAPSHPSVTGDPQPAFPAVGAAPPTYSELRVFAEELPEFDQQVRWVYADETSGVGNGKTFDGNATRGKMKVGDFWFHVAADITIPALKGRAARESAVSKATVGASKYSRIYLFHQRSLYAYSRLEIVGLEHKNFVYQGLSVTISAKDALNDLDDESGFLVPLHYPSLKNMGLMRSTQLAYSSTYLVFNTYKVVVKKWWQKGIFKILMVIAAAVLAVVFPPAGVGLSASGLLGANLAIGAALGFTSAMGAAIAGAIANALATMVLTSLIQAGATEIFGEKFGAILGTIISFATMHYAHAYATTGTFQVDWGSILRVDNIMKLTNSVTGAYSAWLRIDTISAYEDMAGLEDEYDEKMDKVSAASKEMLGMTAGVIDPMLFTEALDYTGESSSEFFSRTMLTGGEIAELSQSMIYDFAEISLELPTLRA